MEEKIIASTALEKYEYYFVQYSFGEMDSFITNFKVPLKVTNSFIFFYLDMTKPSIN